MSNSTQNHTGRPVLSGLTATGSSQATAYPLLNSGDHQFGTVAASTGAMLPVGRVPSSVRVFNGGASTLSIYPPVGGAVNGGSANASVSLAAGAGIEFFAEDMGTWYATSTAGGGSGSGTVTSASVVSANGFAGTVATATTTPAITISTSVTGILKGNGTAVETAISDTDYQAPITLTTTGSSGAATFAANALNIPQYSGGGSGTVTSVDFVGDGVVLSSTPSTAVTTTGGIAATLANAAAMTILANATGTSAAPAYVYGLTGTPQVLTAASTTLTAASPTHSVLNATSNNVAAVLPAAATCPGKVMSFSTSSGAHSSTVTLNAADTYGGSATGASFGLAPPGATGVPGTFSVISGGSTNAWYPITSQAIPISQIYGTGATGGLYVASNSNGGIGGIAAVAAGQLLVSAGTSTPPAYASTGLIITQALIAIPTAAYASTINLDLSTGSIFAPAALTGNPALTLTNAPAATPWVRPFTLILTQDGTGSRTITSWFTGFTIRWAGGPAPTLTTTASKSDVVNFIQIAATTLLGSIVGQNY